MVVVIHVNLSRQTILVDAAASSTNEKCFIQQNHDTLISSTTTTTEPIRTEHQPFATAKLHRICQSHRGGTKQHYNLNRVVVDDLTSEEIFISPRIIGDDTRLRPVVHAKRHRRHHNNHRRFIKNDADADDDDGGGGDDDAAKGGDVWFAAADSEMVQQQLLQPVDVHWPVKKEAIMEGDLVLGGLMMVHSREDSIMCGPIMPQGGIQALEVMLYTLDRINRDGLLPNITIGAHILDDCDRDSYGLEMAVDFIKGNFMCT